MLSRLAASASVACDCQPTWRTIRTPRSRRLPRRSTPASRYSIRPGPIPQARKISATTSACLPGHCRRTRVGEAPVSSRSAACAETGAPGFDGRAKDCRGRQHERRRPRRHSYRCFAAPCSRLSRVAVHDCARSGPGRQNRARAARGGFERVQKAARGNRRVRPRWLPSRWRWAPTRICRFGAASLPIASIGASPFSRTPRSEAPSGPEAGARPASCTDCGSVCRLQRRRHLPCVFACGAARDYSHRWCEESTDSGAHCRRGAPAPGERGPGQDRCALPRSGRLAPPALSRRGATPRSS